MKRFILAFFFLIGALTPCVAQISVSLPPFVEGTCTPALTFGGSSSGITYGTQLCNYRQIGTSVTVNVYIVLTNNGSGSGNSLLTITGIPTSAASVLQACAFSGGALSLTGSLQAVVNSSSTQVTLQQITAGVAATLTDSNIPDTGILILTCSYKSV